MKNPYLKVLDCNCKNIYSLRNFNSINLFDTDMTLESTNEVAFSTINKFSKYILSMIDVQASLIEQLTAQFKDYGLELIGLPIDKNLHSVHRVLWRFTELGRQLNHKSMAHPLRYLSYHTAHLEFKLSTPDISIFTDFRNKYQNLDAISNFTQFWTKDSLDNKWLSSIFWNPIDVSFNQDYSQDELSNLAFEAAFSADVTYNIIYDERLYNIQGIILTIMTHSTSDGSTIITEH